KDDGIKRKKTVKFADESSSHRMFTLHLIPSRHEQEQYEETDEDDNDDDDDISEESSEDSNSEKEYYCLDIGSYGQNQLRVNADRFHPITLERSPRKFSDNRSNVTINNASIEASPVNGNTDENSTDDVLNYEMFSISKMLAS
ncbi:hypothetical protein SNEBB_006003, partial [Seison nebaliae]